MITRRARCRSTLGKVAGATFLAGAVTVSVAAGDVGATTSPSLAQARKALLVLGDFPKGWTASKSSNTNTAPPGTGQLARCLGVPTSVLTTIPPTVYSKEFSNRKQQLSVDDNVSVYPSAQAAQADFGTFTNAKTPTCFTTYMNGPGKAELTAGAPAGTTVGSILITRTPASNYAPNTANYTMFFPITASGQTINAEVTEVDYVKGNQEQTMTLSAYQNTFPASLSKQLTAVAVGRL
jgi:hypothetical protein